CRPKTNIVFLKTHKCASSAILNILFRYGTGRDLNFVLPKTEGACYIGHPTPFHRRLIDDITIYNMTFNILTHHTRYNGKEIHKVMPNDTVYVTILRTPCCQFESLYSYCKLGRIYKRNLSAFVESKNLTLSLARKRVVDDHVGFNQMSFDLGFRSQLPRSKPQSITNFIHSIDREFDLVMIAERLDESLILLKHLLCWNTSDIVTFKINARYAEYKEELSADVKKKLSDLNYVDVMLYQYFANVLERKVQEFGVDKMAAEVQELQKQRMKYYSMCVEAEQPSEVASKNYKRKDVIAFKLKNNSEECRQMTLTERDFDELVTIKQKARKNKLK
ncbi:unnamed protein product, partial [Ixodes hexagonus]